MEKGYVVKQDKFTVFAACVLNLVIIIFFLVIAIWALYNIIKNEYTVQGGFTMDIFCSCGSLCVIAILTVLLIYFIIMYQKQFDVYYKDKMVRKVGEKTVFELDYREINSIKIGFHSLYIFCKQSVKREDGKNGQRTICAHYSPKDIEKVKLVINSSNNSFNYTM